MSGIEQLHPRERAFLERQIQQRGELAGLSLFAYDRNHMELLPENGEKFLIEYFVNEIDSLSGLDLVSFTHHGCHVFEDGRMTQKAYHKIGIAILDKLIEKAEQGFNAHANRSIAGYWESVKDDSEALDGLKAVLEKHPNYPFAQKYLGYINGAEPENIETLKERYLKDPNMLFVTTPLVDVDGTLIKDGKINDTLIFELIRCERDTGNFAIYTGGDPKSQKEVLLKASAESILEKYPLTGKTYTVDAILKMYSTEDEANLELRKDLIKTIEEDSKQAYLEELETTESEEEKTRLTYGKMNWIHRRSAVGEEILEFIHRLETKTAKEIKIYPKQAFVQDNICLAGVVVDDTQPEAQEMKSLSMAVLTPQESTLFKNSAEYLGGEKLDVPTERKITAEQVFEIYQQEQQKEQLTSTVTNKLKKLKDKTKSEKIEDIPHAKTQILREIAKDNLGKPKRSDADKRVIKAAVNKAISKTRK